MLNIAILLGGLLMLAADSSDEMKKIVPPDAKVEKLAGGFQFTEGPVWSSADGGYLIFSDIPGNRLIKWTRDGGAVTFREPSHNANGNTRDHEGRLVTAGHGSRTVTRTEKDGAIGTLVETFDGKRFNSPNDIVVKRDGTIWFTDPTYGLKQRTKEQPGNYVYCFDPKMGNVMPVVKDCDQPNGLCFSPDEKKLYIADSGQPRNIRVFNIQPDNTLTGGDVFCTIGQGGPDGIRVDTEGRLYSTAEEGIRIFTPTGQLIGSIQVPETPANLCFGGEGNRTLFMTARTGLYSIRLNPTGAVKH